MSALASKNNEANITSANLKFSTERTLFLKALTHVQSVVERKNTIEILSNIKFEAEGSILKITGTDMGISVVETIPAEINQDCSFTIPAQTLLEIVRKLPDGSRVEFHINQMMPSSVIILSGSAEFTLPSLPAEDFPVMEGGNMQNNFVLNAEEIISLFTKTQFAISAEETRFYLNGIFLHNKNEGEDSFLCAVATDGHRLAKNKIDLPEGASNIPGVIIPRKTVHELIRILEDCEEEVKISLSLTKIAFKFDNISILSKLIDGNFPDYDRVVPKDNCNIMEINKKELVQSVERVAILSPDKTRAIRFEVFSGRLVISTSNDLAGANEEVKIKYNGPTIDIGFNVKYLLEMISVFDGDIVKFVFDSGKAPAIVEDTGNPNTLYVLMPMRI